LTTHRPLVLRVITRLAGGGPPVHATLLNRTLERHGFDSLLVFGDCSTSEKNMEYLLSEHDHIARIPSLGANPNLVKDLQALFQLWRLMMKHRPAVVHTHTAKAGFLGRIAALLAGVPCIVHTYHGHVLEGYFGPVLNGILRLVEQGLGSLSSALCSVSKQQVDELSQRFSIASPAKFHVVPLGVDLEPLLELPPPDFFTSRLTIGWLGRFVPIKNLKLLIQIATEASKRNLPVNFIVAGDGPDRPWLEASIRVLELKNICLLPWQDHIDFVLKDCHALILTSHREGTPLALIQGMAAARPFLATPAGGTVDLACGVSRPDGDLWWYENAVLSAPATEPFLRAIEYLLVNRQMLADMSQSARSFAASKFSQHRLASDIACLYEQLLRERGIVSKSTLETIP